MNQSTKQNEITLDQAMDMFSEALECLYVDMHEEGNFSSERAFEKLVSWCHKSGMAIEDEEYVNYDQPIHNHYASIQDDLD